MMQYILFFLLITPILFADSEEIAQKAHIANINTLLIFTSQDTLNAGKYTFEYVGVDMELLNLPFTYHFHSDTKLNYFLLSNIGYSRVYISKDILLPPDSRLDYDNHLRTYTAGLGGGIRYKVTNNISLLCGTELIYSRSGASVKQPDDDLGDAIEDFFNNNYNDNISYEFLFQAIYKGAFRYIKPYVIATHKIFDTKSTFSFNELIKITTLSTISTLSFGAETQPLLHLNHDFITLEGYYHYNYLVGDVYDVVKFRNFNTFGGVFYYNTPHFPSWSRRFFVEFSGSNSQGLHGYNLGIGLSVDF